MVEVILNNLDLKHLYSTFQREKITLEVLPLLGDDEFRRLGVETIGDCIKLRLQGRNVLQNYDSGFETKDGIEALKNSGYSIQQIADLYGCSTATVYRRMKQFHIRKKDLTSKISDNELDELLKYCSLNFRRWGEKLLRGHILGLGLQVSRQRLRDATHRVDPTAVTFRTKKVLKRRQYFVKGPNKLVHCDGNEKLKRWQIYIHGAIDGYSRKPVYLIAAQDKKSSTVLDAFVAATILHGLPSRIRIDKGKENVKIGLYMIAKRGPNRGSCITGPSTRNQRIERFRRDVFEKCLCLFYDLFSCLEEDGLLDVNSRDIAALRYTYFNIIQQHLNIFTTAWNNHRVRTAFNLTPHEMFYSRPFEDEKFDFNTNGILQIENEDWLAITEENNNSLEESKKLFALSEEEIFCLNTYCGQCLELNETYLKEKYIQAKNILTSLD